MKVKVSKTFADYINKTAKEKQLKFHASMIKVGMEFYWSYIDADIFRAEEYGDYDTGDGEFRAILIDYPYGCYAAPRYLTSYMLKKESQRYSNDEEGLKRMIIKLCEV